MLGFKGSEKENVDRSPQGASNRHVKPCVVWLARLVAFVLGGFGIPPPFDGLIPGGCFIVIDECPLASKDRAGFKFKQRVCPPASKDRVGFKFKQRVCLPASKDRVGFKFKQSVCPPASKDRVGFRMSRYVPTGLKGPSRLYV